MLWQLDIHKQKNEVGSLPLSITKINSTGIKDVSRRVKTIKLFKNKNKGIPLWPWMRQRYLRWHQKHKQQEKTDKQYFIKIENMCFKGHYQYSEKTINRMGNENRCPLYTYTPQFLYSFMVTSVVSIYIHNEILFSHKMKEILSFATTWTLC